MKNKKKVIAVLCSLLLLGFVATSLVSYIMAHNLLSQQIEESALPLTSDTIYSEIQRDLSRPVFISSLMAQDTFLRDWTLDGEHDADKILRYLQQIQQSYATITAFFVSDKTHRYYHPTGILKTVSPDNPQDAWFFRARKLNNDYEINVDVDTAHPDRMTVFVNYRIYDYSGKLLGITGVGLDVTTVARLIKTYEKRYNRLVYFIDREGQVVLHGENFSYPDNIRKRNELQRYATQLLATSGHALSFNTQHGTSYLNSRFIPEFNWYLIVEQSGAHAEGTISHSLMLNLGISIVIMAIILMLVYFTLGGYQKQLEAAATYDKLTGLLNRQTFDVLVEKQLHLAQRRQSSMVAILADIDHFKTINDNYGHLAGDFVLQSIAGTLRYLVRDSDLLCRWGGEEFLFLLQDCSLEHGLKCAEEMRTAIEERAFTYKGKTLNITASLGLAVSNADDNCESLFHRADQALYLAKQQGRNRVRYVK